MIEWEHIDGVLKKYAPQRWMDGPNGHEAKQGVWRAKVPGGWLVCRSYKYENSILKPKPQAGLTFVPDPNHSWNP